MKKILATLIALAVISSSASATEFKVPEKVVETATVVKTKVVDATSTVTTFVKENPDEVAAGTWGALAGAAIIANPAGVLIGAVFAVVGVTKLKEYEANKK